MKGIDVLVERMGWLSDNIKEEVYEKEKHWHRNGRESIRKQGVFGVGMSFLMRVFAVHLLLVAWIKLKHRIKQLQCGMHDHEYTR